MSFQIKKSSTSNVVQSSVTPVQVGGNDSQVYSNVANTFTFAPENINQNTGEYLPADSIGSIQNSPSFGSRQFQFSCLAPNGNIYCGPNDSGNQYLIINPYTNTYSLRTSILNTRAGGAVCAYNGKAYFPCYSGTPAKVRVLDTITNTEYLLDTEAGRGFYGAVLHPNGNIYCIPSDFPFNNPKVMVINPNNDNISYIDVSGISWPNTGIGDASGDDTWYGGVLALNGKIYGMPARGTSVLVIDPYNNTAQCDVSGLTVYGLPVPTPGSQVNKFNGGVLAPNGYIYALPGSSLQNIYVLDTSNNTFTSTPQIISTTRRCIGGTLAPNGKIYCSLDTGTFIAVIVPNPTTPAITRYDIPTGSNANGTCLAPNGRVYILPRSTQIKYIETGFPTQQPWMLAPEFNKH